MTGLFSGVFVFLACLVLVLFYAWFVITSESDWPKRLITDMAYHVLMGATQPLINARLSFELRNNAWAQQSRMTGLPSKEKVWLYLELFGYDTRVWRTDGQTHDDD